jgi:hypothetical protein
VQKDAAWLDKKIAGPTNSSTVAMRPSGVSASNFWTCSATSGHTFIELCGGKQQLQVRFRPVRGVYHGSDRFVNFKGRALPGGQRMP